MEKKLLINRRISAFTQHLPVRKAGRFASTSPTIKKKKVPVKAAGNAPDIVSQVKMPVQPQGYIKCKKYDCL